MGESEPHLGSLLHRKILCLLDEPEEQAANLPAEVQTDCSPTLTQVEQSVSALGLSVTISIIRFLRVLFPG